MRKNVSIVQLVIQLVLTFALFGKKKPDKKGRPQMFLKGIDYQYCKGCLKCVHACPVDALSSAVETNDGYADANRVPHLFELVK